MIEISKKITKIVGQTNAKYSLIQDKDKVLVGFSGGKDSLTLIHTLKRLQKVAPYSFDFKAVTINYGMGEDLSYLKQHCLEHNIDYEVIDTSIYEIAQTKIRENSSYCSFFSRLRRGHLYSYAKDNGYNKLALGHHLDDAMESFFMNLFFNGALRSMPPKYKAQNGLWVIRPLLFCRERQLSAFAKTNNIHTIGDEACPAMKIETKAPYNRAKTKQMIRSLEEENPQLFVSMKSAFQNIQTNSFFDKELLDKEEL